MRVFDAIELIRRTIPQIGGAWADIGAGDGMFTRALVDLLGPTARVYAVDRDPEALADLESWASEHDAHVIPVLADFTGPFELPGMDGAPLDGLILANALHFVREPERVLGELASRVRPGGRVVVVEYDRHRPDRWVPYPVPSARLADLARAAGLSMPIFTAMRPSAYGGSLYAASADRPPSESSGVVAVSRTSAARKANA